MHSKIYQTSTALQHPFTSDQLFFVILGPVLRMVILRAARTLLTINTLTAGAVQICFFIILY